MLVRDLISEKQKIDEVAIAIPLGQILTQMLNGLMVRAAL